LITVPIAWVGTPLFREKAPQTGLEFLYLVLLVYGWLIGNLVFLWIGYIVVRLPGKRRKKVAAQLVTLDQPTISGSPVQPAKVSTSRRRATGRWSSCNVLSPGAVTRQLWQFNAGGKFNLLRSESRGPGEPLPDKLVAKDWQTLLQPRLNVAWLSADKAFVRTVQLPKADAAETRSMVEFQLEKLSPLPVAQIVWSYEVLPRVPQAGLGQEFNPHATGEVQTVVVIMADHDSVEEYLGQIEGQGYLADRLELPLLDELRATKVKENGAWIFPNLGGQDGLCMVAWWYDGVLQNLSIVHLPPGETRAAVLQEQLAQTTWAGEVEGWLTSEVRFHLVADEATSGQWTPLFDLSQPVDIVPPVPQQELAALTARRVASNGTSTNLLPPEFAARYKQVLVDRIWMRGLGALLMAYIAYVIIYFGFTQYGAWRYNSIQSEITSLGSSYTNTVQLREKVRVLRDTLELQYAALECYLSVAKSLPSELTLKSMNFERGRTVRFFGTAGAEDGAKVYDFNAGLIGYTVKDQPLYAKVNPPNSQTDPSRTVMNWNFSCELKRTDNTE